MPMAMKLIRYLFGRHAMLGVASIVLVIVSGFSVWSGLDDFVVGTATADHHRPVFGLFSVSDRQIVLVIVAILTFCMWLFLKETLAPNRRVIARFVAGSLYVLLTLWSIGFGYGFWWSLIAGEDATRASLANFQEDTTHALQLLGSKLRASKTSLIPAYEWSQTQMDQESTSGGTCGVKSNKGKGPLFSARLGVNQAVLGVKDIIARDWEEPLTSKISLAQQAIVKTYIDGSREQQFKDKARDIRALTQFAMSINDSMTSSLAISLKTMAAGLDIPPNTPGFSCYDPTLAAHLRIAADGIAKPMKIDIREATFNEGASGVANAIRNLWANLLNVVSGNSVVASALSGRDIIALIATVGIDLAILAIAILNNPYAGVKQSQGHSLRRRSEAQVSSKEVLADVRQMIIRTLNPEANPAQLMGWFKLHIVHHSGDDYLIIPNLHAVHSAERVEQITASTMNRLVGLLTSLNLVETLGDSDLRLLSAGETRISDFDLTEAKEWWRQSVKSQEDRGANLPATAGRDMVKELPTRSHGLVSKGTQALNAAGWNLSARNDLEVFRLVTIGNVTPLLSALSQD